MQAVETPPTQQQEETKRCPYCAEEILSAAIKCKHCGEFLDRAPRPKSRWYQSNTTMVMSLLTLGPLALPVVWLNPRLNIFTKIVITAVMGVVTYAVIKGMVNIYTYSVKQLESLNQIKLY